MPDLKNTYQVHWALDKHQLRIAQTITAANPQELTNKIKFMLTECKDGHLAEVWLSGRKHTITRDRKHPEGVTILASRWQNHTPSADPDNCAGLINPDPTKGY